MNQQWIFKSLKKRKDKDVSATRKASHERFLKNINQSFVKANGVGLNWIYVKSDYKIFMNDLNSPVGFWGFGVLGFWGGYLSKV